ncbi:MAG: nicotinate-nicotinamide nucleotide adenylyltransferase [Anaerovoracaceae bacterium]
MINTTIEKFLSESREALLSKELLQHFNYTREEMSDFIDEARWYDIMKSIIIHGSYRAETVVDMLKAVTDNICDEPEGGWVKFICDETVARLYPDNFTERGSEMQHKAMYFILENYRCILKFEKSLRSFSPVDDFMLCDEDEIESSHNSIEYRTFLKFWDEYYIYEFMRMNREITPFNTLGHIAGVHHVATFIGRQFVSSSVPIDLPLLSAAAASHDIGKFGCTEQEKARIPYLHYYYINELCFRLDMPMIGHIAGNHSTWDLELENLSIENLLLIYADFRVRSSRINGSEKVGFYSLDDAFSIILSKLDNMDEAKKSRYEKVYMKLKDFERYMENMGVETNLSGKPSGEIASRSKDTALLMGNDVVENLKYIAIEHNIRIMSIFNDEAAFGSLLESARTEKKGSNLRSFLNIFDEYSTYMTKQEKMMTLHFLYDALSHKEGDIRRQAAAIMGKIIASYKDPLRKELPENVEDSYDDSIEIWNYYLNRIVFPGHRVTDQHRSWIRYTLKIILQTLVAKLSGKRVRLFIGEFFKLFDMEEMSDNAAFVLLDSALYINTSLYTEELIFHMLDMMMCASMRKRIEVKIAVLRLCEQLSKMPDLCEEASGRISLILANLDSLDYENISAAYILRKTRRNLTDSGLTDQTIIRVLTPDNRDAVSSLLREDLKVGTPWILKTINIEFLLDYTRYDATNGRDFYLASHFSNLLKVSEKVTVRCQAGESLISVCEKLPMDQVNEIVIELSKGLEIGDYQFSKYIPHYLGRICLLLSPGEFNEFIGNLAGMVDSSNDKISSVALHTLGEILENYSLYRHKENESAASYIQRRQQMLGLLLKGMSNYHESVSQEAFTSLGIYIFGSDVLTEKEKFDDFRYIYKKMLTLINHSESNDINFYTNAAALNHVYRFVSEYTFNHGQMNLPENKKIAFFPGTFDPFSLGHRGIVNAIKNEGFETYLALDEFSWSKNTQPRMLRRQIITMSVAPEPDVFMFPDDFPVNIANPSDLRKLKNLFPGKEVYMVAGSDVIINASSYRAEPVRDSIHSMNHVIFRRESQEIGESKLDALREAYDKITGEIHELTLPVYLEDISSTQIRDNIDYGRDISKLIDPVAQNYIYDNSLYLREPMNKSILEAKDMLIENISEVDHKLMEEMHIRYLERTTKRGRIMDYLDSEGVHVTILRDRKKEMIGFAAYHELEANDLFEEFGDINLANYLRQKSPGRMLVIRTIYIDDSVDIMMNVKILLTEILAEACEKNLIYSVYHPIEDKASSVVNDVLTRLGFLKIKLDGSETMIYEVDMSNPIVVIENMNTVIKTPFNTNEKVLKVFEETHAQLQRALAGLEPGNLVLSFNSGIMNQKIIKMVTQANDVPCIPRKEKKLGPLMCVPFGKILSGTVVPNTVTKTLHTEKKFTRLLDKFEIVEYPMYATIANQIKTIKSFNRSVILVDDILHKGYRIKYLDKYFKLNGVTIEQMIVGVLSGRGKDLMKLQGRDVDSAYFIPNMREWFVESTMYPFIGGDSIETSEKTRANLIPSINLIPPFAAPGFLYTHDYEAVYNLADTCLENAYKVFRVLEEEYQNTFERQLTIRRLSDVIKQPRMPNGADRLSVDFDLSPSSYMKDYKDRLLRLKKAML